MNKNLRLPLFGLLGVAIVGLGAAIVFSGSKKDDPTPPTTTDTPSETPAPVTNTEVNETTPLTFGDTPAVTTAAPVVATGAPGTPATVQTKAATPDKSQPAKSAPVKGSIVMYELKKGETLGKVASNFGCRVSEIYQLNPDITEANSTRLREGRKFKVRDNKGVGGTPVDGTTTVSAKTPGSTSSPTPGSADSVNCEPTEISAQPERAPEAVKAPAKPDFTVAHVHKLKRGDNYFELSRTYYGAVSYWRVIRDANPDWEPFNFTEGTEINIPALKSADSSASTATVERPASSSVIPPMKRE